MAGMGLQQISKVPVVSTFTEQDAHVDELTVGEEFGAFLCDH